MLFLSQDIVATKFLWVKYKVIRTTAPGFYAAINITRKATSCLQIG